MSLSTTGRTLRFPCRKKCKTSNKFFSGKNQIGAIFSNQLPAIGLSHKINFHDYLSFRSSILYGTLKADDALSNDLNTQSRNLSFRSQILDLNIGFEFNFKRFKIHKRKTIYSPYIYAGLSFFTFNPQAQKP